MAAPTPISSLVHSSTLVTAGLYLIIRNYDILSASRALTATLICLGLFTSFYGGFSSLLERDLKKVVALSTLSHLGFIAFALGLGWCNLAIFHLLAHAFFKSTLFISLGSIISFRYHYQDSRFLSSTLLCFHVPRSVITVSVFNLFALPFIRGFYSKDFILETLGYSRFGVISLLGVYLNLCFTFIYTLRIVCAIILWPKTPRYRAKRVTRSAHILSLSLLSGYSIRFGVLYIQFICLPHFGVPLLIKMIPV